MPTHTSSTNQSPASQGQNTTRPLHVFLRSPQYHTNMLPVRNLPASRPRARQQTPLSITLSRSLPKWLRAIARPRLQLLMLWRFLLRTSSHDSRPRRCRFPCHTTHPPRRRTRLHGLCTLLLATQTTFSQSTEEPTIPCSRVDRR